MIAERDLVVVRSQASGLHIGEIDGFPASRHTFSVQHINCIGRNGAAARAAVGVLPSRKGVARETALR